MVAQRRELFYRSGDATMAVDIETERHSNGEILKRFSEERIFLSFQKIVTTQWTFIRMAINS